MTNLTPELAIHLLPDGRRVYAGVQLALALGVQHDNLLRNVHRVMEVWPTQAGGFTAGVWRDSRKRRRQQYWISAAGLCALIAVSVGRPACLLRTQVDHWCRRLLPGRPYAGGGYDHAAAAPQACPDGSYGIPT